MAYVAPLVLRLDGLSAATESPYGTDAAPVVTTNAIRPGGRLWPQLHVEYLQTNLRDDAASGGLVPLPPAKAAARRGTLTFDWEIRGLGSAYSSSLPTGAVEADPLIQACGWLGTFSSSPSNQWTYIPVGTQARPSATVYAYAAGRLFKLVGTRGRMRLTFTPGKIATASFNLMGMIVADWTDVALPSNFAYNAQLPPPAVNQAVTIGPWTPDYQSLVIDGGNDVQTIMSGNAADAIQSIDFGFMAPTVEVRGLVIPTATYDPLLDQKSATSRALSLSLNGGTQYNRMSFTDTLYAISATYHDESRFAGKAVMYRGTVPSLLFN